MIDGANLVCVALVSILGGFVGGALARLLIRRVTQPVELVVRAASPTCDVEIGP